MSARATAGYNGLWVLLKTCTYNCMQDAKSQCCFVPSEVAWMLPPGLQIP